MEGSLEIEIASSQSKDRVWDLFKKNSTSYYTMLGLITDSRREAVVNLAVVNSAVVNLAERLRVSFEQPRTCNTHTYPYTKLASREQLPEKGSSSC